MTQRSEAQATPYGGLRLERLLSIREVADILGVSRATVYSLMHSRELVPIRVGERARFDPEGVRNYIERKRAAAVR